MALGDSYATTTELVEWTNIPDSSSDTQLTRALAATSRAVEHYCHRQFNDAGSASARVFEATSCSTVYVDDFHTTTGLIVATDSDDDGTFETTIASTNYTLRPLNGVVNGRAGWPWSEIELRGSAWFPTHGPFVQVTARWGWAAVPSEVKEATLLKAAQVFSRRNSPNGLIGQGEFRISRYEDSDVRRLLDPYRDVSVGIA